MTRPQIPDSSSNSHVTPALIHSDSLFISPPKKYPSPLHAFVLILLLIVIFAAWFPTLSGDFVWDDIFLILNDPSVHTIRSPFDFLQKSFLSNLQNEGSAYFRPIVTFSFALDWQIWNGLPGGFHLTNILIHLANCFLIFSLIRKLGGQFVPSLFAMVFFGLSPRMAESVAWISGRTDLCATFFVLLALFCVLSLQNKKKNSVPLRISQYAALFLCLWAGLLSKEVALAGLVATVALQFRFFLLKKTSLKCAIGVSLISFFASIACLFLRWQAFDVSLRQNYPTMHFNHFGEWIQCIFRSVGAYFLRGIYFFGSNFQSGPQTKPDTVLFILGIAVVALIILFFAKTGWRACLSSESFPFFILSISALLPVLQIIPLEHKIIAADRFLYLPTAGFCIALPISLSSKIRASGRCHWLLLILLAVAMLSVCFASTRSHVRVWQNGSSLYSWACFDDRNALGCILLAGLELANGHPEKVFEASDMARISEGSDREQATWMDYSLVHAEYLRAQALIALGKNREARQALSETMKGMRLCLVGPPAEDVALWQVKMLLREGEWKKADEFIQENMTAFDAPYTLLKNFARLKEEVWALSPPQDAIHPLERPLNELSVTDLTKAARLAELFGDRLAQTRICLEILTRSEATDSDQKTARDFLEHRSICSALPETASGFTYPAARCASRIDAH